MSKFKFKCPKCNVVLRQVVDEPPVYHCDWCDTNYGAGDFSPNTWVDLVILAVVCLFVLGVCVPVIYSLFR